MNEVDMMALANALQILMPVLLFAILMAWIQFNLCRSKRTFFVKLIPGMIVSIIMGICIWQVCLWNAEEHTLFFAISFLAGLYIGGLLLGCCAAWAAYLIGQYAKKRRK